MYNSSEKEKANKNFFFFLSTFHFNIFSPQSSFHNFTTINFTDDVPRWGKSVCSYGFWLLLLLLKPSPPLLLSLSVSVAAATAAAAAAAAAAATAAATTTTTNAGAVDGDKTVLLRQSFKYKNCR